MKDVFNVFASVDQRLFGLFGALAYSFLFLQVSELIVDGVSLVSDSELSVRVSRFISDLLTNVMVMEV